MIHLNVLYKYLNSNNSNYKDYNLYCRTLFLSIKVASVSSNPVLSSFPNGFGIPTRIS